MSETLGRDTSHASAGELVEALARRDVSSVELFEAAIARIEDRDGSINAVIIHDFDRAYEAAKAADSAIARGERRALLGLPMTVKESHNVAGLATTWGFSEAKEFRASIDSVGVQRLKTAGAVILGKTNIPVSLADWQSVNPVYGRTSNPWDVTRTAGGSSGGAAAALAAGMVPLEFGSDIGGSIRVPAAFCGVYGHKPSYNLVPQRGHAPPGLDGGDAPIAVLGPLAVTADDLALALDVLAGPVGDEATGYLLDLPSPRHAALSDYSVLMLDHHPLAALDKEVKQALTDLADHLDRQGATVARRSSLLPDLESAHQVYLGILGVAMSRGGPSRPDALSAHAWLDLLDAQVSVRRQWAELFKTFDVVLAPVFGTTAFEHLDEPDPTQRTLLINGKSTAYFDQLAWSGMATLAHLPATSAPIGASVAGLPIGVQIIGPYLEDRMTIEFARLLEREFGRPARAWDT
ncbi:amidase family protein [Phenylobacterium sp.]|uniref:amidase family protein n=1 Tax=Phenylobacterium sp. TaxID=1871053 RepID=UPI00286A2393|nr:amidase family protein [Phenylobacterium sp.]